MKRKFELVLDRTRNLSRTGFLCYQFRMPGAARQRIIREANGSVACVRNVRVKADIRNPLRCSVKENPGRRSHVSII